MCNRIPTTAIVCLHWPKGDTIIHSSGGAPPAEMHLVEVSSTFLLYLVQGCIKVYMNAYTQSQYNNWRKRSKDFPGVRN